MDSHSPAQPNQGASPYALTPEQIAQAKREEEEFQRLQERVEAERWVNGSHETPFNSTMLAIAIGGAVFLALLLWTVHIRGGSVGWVITGGLCIPAGIWLIANIDTDMPMIRVSGAGLMVTGLWCLILGLFMSAEELEMLDPTTRAEAMAERMEATFTDSASRASRSTQPSSRTVGTQVMPTGGTGASIQVRNTFNCTQHVFIDGQWVGTVAVGDTATWNVNPGSHRLVCADSRDMSDNPVTEWMDVERGEVEPFNVFVQYN